MGIKIIVPILILGSIVCITMRFVLKKSDKKGMLRLLTVSWIVCLVISGFLISNNDEKITPYVAPTAVYKGYWYNVKTGAKIRDEVDLVGGQGSPPAVVFTLSVFSFAIISLGIGYGISILASKEKSMIAKMITIIIFFIFFYSVIKGIARF